MGDNEQNLASVTDAKMTYDQRLFKFTLDFGQGEAHFLTFRGLQRLNILQLQNSLAKCKQETWKHSGFTEEHSGQLKQLLHDYSMYSTIRRIGTSLIIYCSKRNQGFRVSK